MRTVYKYPIQRATTKLELDAFARILHVGLDPSGQPCLWALVDTEETTKKLRTFECFFTGENLARVNASGYVGTFIDGALVYHVFEIY